MSNVMFAETTLETDYAVPVKAQSGMARGPRLGLTLGGLGLGAFIGFAAAMSIGRSDLFLNVLGAGAFALALPLGVWGVRQSIREHAYGCAALALLHMAALIGWLGMSVSAYGPPLGVSAPALITLVLFASCWSRTEGGVYRSMFQALIIGIAASAQFMTMATGI